MDGAPLANAQVIFSPDGGRPSTGVTDAAGKYTLTYIRDVKGAKLGAHSVRVETVPAVTSDQAVGITPEGPPSAAETIPAKYNTESELRAEVKPGENTIDFSLNSK
ncbi:MAG TPA: carboxypeptidase regulatory-like domain-containing protein [Pirellulales bacterium]